MDRKLEEMKFSEKEEKKNMTHNISETKMQLKFPRKKRFKQKTE